MVVVSTGYRRMRKIRHGGLEKLERYFSNSTHHLEPPFQRWNGGSATLAFLHHGEQHLSQRQASPESWRRRR